MKEYGNLRIEKHISSRFTEEAVNSKVTKTQSDYLELLLKVFEQTDKETIIKILM